MILYTKSNTDILNFTIYGERHSGTKFLQKLVQKNFNLPVTWNFGWKHFFGLYDTEIKDHGQNTLFIGIVRNPYDWIMAMNKKAYHVPYDISKSIDSLLFSEWRSVNKFGKEKIDYNGRYEDRNYINGNRYKNIFDLRYHKNVYLLEHMPNIANHYCLITYDDLISKPHDTISEICINLQLNEKFSYKFVHPHYRDPYYIDEPIKNSINENIMWDIENKLGFYVKN